MPEQGYDVTLRLKGDDGLTRVVKKPTTAMDLLARAADPKAKRSFRAFSISAFAGLKLVHSGAKLVGRGLRGMGSLALTAFHKIARGAKIAALAGGVLAGVLVSWGADIVEMENLFTVSMGKMVAEAEAWASGISKSLRVNENDIKKYLGTFNVMLESMGLAADKAFEMSKGLTQLAFDMASFYNLDVDEAFEKLQAGITGEIEPLKRLGILLNETAVKAYAMANGIGAAGRALTENEKILARYGALMQMTGKAQGDMARTLDSVSNRMKQIWAGIKGIGQEIGKGIVESKVVAAAFGWLSDQFTALSENIDSSAITTKIDEWTDATHNFFTEVVGIGNLWKDIKAGWNDMLGSVIIGTEEKTKTISRKVSYSQDDTGAITKSVDIEKEIVKTQRTLADLSWADVWEVFNDKTLTAIGETFEWIGGKVVEAFEYISSGDARKDWNTLKEDWNAFKETMEQVFEPVGKVLGAMGKWTKANPQTAGSVGLVTAALVVLGPAIVAVAAAVPALYSAIAGLVVVIAGLGAPAYAAVAAIAAVGYAFVAIGAEWTNIKKLFREGWFLIKDLFRDGGAAISGFFIKSWEDIKASYAQSWDQITAGFQTGVQYIRNNWNETMTFWSSKWEATKEGVRVGIDMVKQYFLGLTLDAKRYWNDFTGWLGDIWDSTVGGINAAIGSISSALESAINFMKGLWDSFTAGLVKAWNATMGKIGLEIKNSPSAIDRWQTGLAIMESEFLSFASTINSAKIQPSMADNWTNALSQMRMTYSGLLAFVDANPLKPLYNIPSMPMLQPAPAGAAAPVAGGGGYGMPGGYIATTTHNEYQVTVGGMGRGRGLADELRLARAIANEIKRKER